MSQPKVPGLVGKLRYLCKAHPEKRETLLRAAADLIKTIRSLGTPPERWEGLTAYAQAARLVAQVTGEPWHGERRT